ncbi:hypothetical protein KKJ06_20990 [Xenorhabdus bovienii]|uniref:hypothetical protein n=1 Tax=Xenorhabdus bovienii TaxID=40576 RepID=UPI0023B255AF|nr:hypothetical protein [Xenorhabdus bovienii]MDE9557813.1 hypothetical protein [Xenorhabdus bovienii]
MRAVLVCFLMTQWVGERRQVTLLVIVMTRLTPRPRSILKGNGLKPQGLRLAARLP